MRTLVLVGVALAAAGVLVTWLALSSTTPAPPTLGQAPIIVVPPRPTPMPSTPLPRAAVDGGAWHPHADRIGVHRTPPAAEEP